MVREEADEGLHEVQGVRIPSPSDFGTQHHESLPAASYELGISRPLAALCDPQHGTVDRPKHKVVADLRRHP